MTLLQRFGIEREARKMPRASRKSAEHARRSCFRMPCLFSFEMRILESDTVASAVCSNLSATGMRINTQSPLERAHTLECWIPTYQKPVVAFAHIVRIEPAARAAAPSYGLQFEHSGEEDEDRLFGHVLDLQRAHIRRDGAYKRRALRPVPALRLGEAQALQGLVRPALATSAGRAVGSSEEF